MFVLAGLVLVSSVVAVLASDWPFWQRAWRWHVAGVTGPARIPGSWRAVGGGAGRPWSALPGPAPEAAALLDLSARPGTLALLAARDGGLLAEHYGAGTGPASLLQGGALTHLLLAPLYGVARQAGLDLLDQPLRLLLPDWAQDPRGDITPRQLLWEVSGLESPAFHPLDPFSARARLAAGPDFARAALDFRATWPPGSHFEVSPANAQLLATVLATARGLPLTELVEKGLWEPLGAGRAQVALDRLGGDMAAHCCFAATARDWLRLARLLAEDGTVGPVRLLPPGFTSEIGRATAVHPAYGLGVEVETTAAGAVLLWGTAPGRLLLAVPGRRLAALWFADGAFDAAARTQLKGALGL